MVSNQKPDAEVNMGQDIYQQLREHVDKIGSGFQATVSDVDLRFLRALFSEEEAELYLHLGEDLETPEEIAKRAKQDPEKVAAILKRMAGKGLLFPKRKGEAYYYAAAPFAHGIYEHQVDRMDKELAQLIEDYMWSEKVPAEPKPDQPAEFKLPLRSIPVQAPINLDRPVARYEDAREIIMNQDRITLAKCVCAVQQSHLENGCDQPLEVCLLLGFYADYYADQGMGRRITQEEALSVLDLAEANGLVHQIPNTQDPAAICNCCPDCCGQLRGAKLLPNPAALITSDHFSKVDAELCNACGICLGYCPMEAIGMADAVACINLDKCIGCGLCVDSCPTEALILAAKPEEARQDPPFTSPFMRSSQDMERGID
jgi:NAD-dependent dihydropyrimidine dehydrogenase PreA subunit